MSTTSRPIPASFVGQSTYGVNTNLNRDRLPVIPDNAQVELEQIIIGKKYVASRLALAGLQAAADQPDILRLVIGAMLEASKTSATAAKLKNPWKTIDVRALFMWGTQRLTNPPDVPAVIPETTPPKDGEAQDAPAPAATAASGENHFPSDSFPEWLSDLEIDDEDLAFALKVSDFEISAYAGILAYAIAKQPNAQNLEAFNQKRRNVVREYMPSGDLEIFVDESKYLDLDTLSKVHRAFNTAIRDRALVISAIIDRDNDLVSNTELMFYALFRLTSGASLNPLLIIVRYARTFPQFYEHFPDLHTEYYAVHHALQRFLDVPEKQRMYLKVLFGSAYSPVSRDDVNKLLGCATFALQQSESNLSNYKGGILSVEHRNKLMTLMNVATRTEEEVPEEKTAIPSE
ncbi:nucleoprotein [Alternaria tenuissima negative-stranded RNA virus 2]|nr:nucleoprotein [Alternaria tenuissima negative-stranded RNA virus 2]